MSVLSGRRFADVAGGASAASAASAARHRPPSPARLGRYQLLAPIASGGMASVHLARQTGQAGFSRTIAIKLLHRHLVEDPEFVAMFQDEARFAARIRHPNVVDVYDVEWVDGELIIVMEYVEGASLQSLIRSARAQGRELARGCLLRVMHDALRGLHAAHELCDDAGEPLGLVHRDVSPQNILVGVDGVARVTDFGVAKARGRATSTRTGMVKGKLHYLAPEQLRGQPIDRRVDCFAAGVVLWECLTDRPLFRADHEAETMMQVLQKSIPPPSSYAPGLGIALDRVCLRALERDPARRFASAAAFAEALEQAARDTFFEPREVGDIVETLRHDSLETLRGSMRGGPPPAAPLEEPSGPEVITESTTIEVPAFDFDQDDQHTDAPTELHRAAPPIARAAVAAQPGAQPARAEATDPSAQLGAVRPAARARLAVWLAALALAVGALFVFVLAPASDDSAPRNAVQPAPPADPPAPAPVETASANEPAATAAPPANGSAAPATTSSPVPRRAGARPRPTRTPKPDAKPSKPAPAGSTPFMPPDI
jgi:serine/threonine-protein kinase